MRVMVHPTVIWLMLFFFSRSIHTAAQQARLMLPVGHTEAVYDACFSPDGKRIVTASFDKTAKIWDVATGDLLADLKGHTERLIDAEYSANGKMILTASFDQLVKIWNAGSAELLYNLQGHTKKIIAAHFSSDNKKVISCSVDGTAKIWDALTGKLLHDLTGHKAAVVSVFFNPDGTKAVTAGWDSTVRVWDCQSGKNLAVFRESTDTINFAQFSHDGNYVVTACANGVAHVWDLDTKEITATFAQEQGILTAVFSPDDAVVLTTGYNNTPVMWNAKTGIPLHLLEGHTGVVWNAAFSKDGTMVATASADNSARVWDALTGKLLTVIRGHKNEVERVEFSADNRKLLTASFDKTASVWFNKTGVLQQNFRGYASGLYAVCVSNDGQRIITPSGDSSIKLWDIKKNGIAYELKGHTDTIKQAIFSPDNRNIVSVSYDKTARLWDAKNGRILAVMQGHTKKIRVVDYSTSGRYIVTGSDDGTAIIWDGKSGALLHRCLGHSERIRSVQFSPDADKLVTASGDSTVKIWETATGKLLRTLTGLEAPVMSAVFSPDGTKIVAAGRNGTAQLWNALTGTPIAALTGHAGIVSTAKYNSSGTRIVTAGADGNVKIWDGNTGVFIKNLQAHAFNIRSAGFNRDGSKIISVSRDNTTKIWDAATGALLHEFKDMIGAVESADITPDGTYLITASAGTAISVWNIEKGLLLYTMFTVGGSDYLVIDKDGHFDGTERARKMLYYTCGTETISLDQVKAKLWVPFLVDSIMKGAAVTEPTLAQADICGLVPSIETLDEGNNFYHYKIIPGRGGLGRTEVFINGNPQKKYFKNQLLVKDGYYELKIAAAEIENYFTGNRANNTVLVKSYTEDNDVTSRGIEIKKKADTATIVTPNLYAVMIGVNDYKGTGMDLNYAEKDAEELSAVLSIAAKKLFNKADTSHVFVYNLTTAKDHYSLPDKKSLRNIFREIGKKATKYDNLVLFFAGHGVTVDKENGGFYFLSADASADNIKTSLHDVGISSAELAAWLHIDSIHIQNRALVFDACNSGQAIKDFVLRMDDLKDLTGLSMLCSSASDQSAYELQQYKHGILTYTLLNNIKENPAVLRKGRLDVVKWFSEAKESVKEMVAGNHIQQDAQMALYETFPVGIVDQEVIAAVKLSGNKTLFAGSQFTNNKDADDAELSKYVNSQLHDVASRGQTQTAVDYNNGSAAPDAWLISGNYSQEGNQLQVQIKVQQNKDSDVRYSFQLSGSKEKINELAAAIVTKAMEWITTQQ